MPYESKSGNLFGGCDGCINLEKNVADNNVLQHSVAILVINKHIILGVLQIHLL